MVEESSSCGITRVGGVVPTHITVYMNSLHSTGEGGTRSAILKQEEID